MAADVSDVLGAVRPRKMRPRIIPALLLRDGQLYKTVNFSQSKYIGDPRVAVKIFNDKGCDELMLLDIGVTPNRTEPDYDLIREIVSESFMPVGYGGGVRSLEQARRIFSLGVEKIVLNTRAIETPEIIPSVSALAGASSTVIAIDVRKDWLGRYRAVSQCGKNVTKLDPVAWAKQAVELGAGEIVVNSIDRDGTMSGYDVPLVSRIAAAVDVPVVALGGAGSDADFRTVIDAGAAAAAAGSYFVFQGPRRAVLISYPEEKRLQTLFDV